MTAKELYHQRKDAGICTTCGKAPARPGRATCPECGAKNNAYTREGYRWNREHGICAACGKAPAEQGIYCFDCWERLADNRERKPMTDEQRERNLQKQKERYARLKAEGVCVECGKHPAIEGKTLCTECMVKNRRRYRNRERKPRGTKKIEWRENGLCCMCGEPVEPGYKVCPKHHQHLVDISGTGWKR